MSRYTASHQLLLLQLFCHKRLSVWGDGIAAHIMVSWNKCRHQNVVKPSFYWKRLASSSCIGWTYALCQRQRKPSSPSFVQSSTKHGPRSSSGPSGPSVPECPTSDREEQMWLRTSTLRWNDPEDERGQREKEGASPQLALNTKSNCLQVKSSRTTQGLLCQGKIDLRVIQPKYGGNTAMSVIEGWFGKKECHAKCKVGQPV